MKKITKIMTSMVAILALAASMSVVSFADGETTDVVDTTITASEDILDAAASETDGSTDNETDDSLDGSIDNEAGEDADGSGEDTDGSGEDTDGSGEGTEDDAEITEDGETDTENGSTAAGDVDAPTTDDKGSPDTGVAGVAGIAGVAIVAGGVLILTSKKRG